MAQPYVRAVPVPVPVAIAALALALSGAAAAADGATRSWDFQGDAVGAAPAGFELVRSGRGAPGRWEVKVDATAPHGDHVVVQTSTDPTDFRFPIAVADAPVLADLRGDVHCKPLSGRVDQACGLVLRYRDPDNYLLARANALEDNVVLFRMQKGHRTEIASWHGRVASGEWHVLGLEARGFRVVVHWDGQKVIETSDRFVQEAGKVGLWTKADSVTAFDGLTVTALP